MQPIFCAKPPRKHLAKKYDVKTSFIRNGSGSTFAKVEAEKNNPQADVWFGGTFDPQAQAAELGLIEPYKSKHIDEIVERFREPAKTKGHYVSSIYMGILGFGVNTERLAKLGIKEVPKCWKDLTDPRLKVKFKLQTLKVRVLLTLHWQLSFNYGAKRGIRFPKELHPNVSQYTKSGITPSRNSARGEATIGVGFLHDYALEKTQWCAIRISCAVRRNGL